MNVRKQEEKETLFGREIEAVKIPSMHHFCYIL